MANGKISIYDRRSVFKTTLLVVGLLIGGLSLYYTDGLVKQLVERERKQVDLYAKTLVRLAETEEGPEQLFLLHDVLESNKSVPVILTDDKENYVSHNNFDIPKRLKGEALNKYLKSQIEEMRAQYQPIEINIEAYGIKQFIFYKDSRIITLLRYYPLLQLAVVGLFGAIAYLAFSTSRKAEQNRVWVGLAKETAHQLGTPLSSLLGWVEYMKSTPEYADDPTGVVYEIEKDVEHLQMIANRFSSIGSTVHISLEPVTATIQSTVDYLSKRISEKVKITVEEDAGDDPELNTPAEAMLNKPLFEWVIENLCKNAVDAMNANGRIDIKIWQLPEGVVAIDISDTGKGMTRQQMKRVFDAGFTTKKRGWGLGLTLTRRIVEDYHKGKIWVLKSEPGKGTTFRIVLGRRTDFGLTEEAKFGQVNSINLGV